MSSSLTSVIEADPALLAEVSLLVETAEGFQSVKYLALASFVWLIYDIFTNIDQEIEFFWDGMWSFTRVLYFFNRYFPVAAFLLQTICMTVILYMQTQDLTVSQIFSTLELPLTCDKAMKAVTIAEIIGIIFCEVTLVIRVYYLWSRIRVLQAIICIAAVGCLSVALVYGGRAVSLMSATRLPAPLDQGCLATGNGNLLATFVPVLILSTFLFIMTLARIFRTLKAGEYNSLTQHLLRDGALFHFVVTLTIALDLAASSNISNLKFSLPVLLSNIIYASHAVCVSHLVLNLHSLAAFLGNDAYSLLSNVELGRVNWRKGINMNELVVDIDHDDMESADQVDLQSLDVNGKISIQTTRVGMFDPPPEQFGTGYEISEAWRTNSLSIDLI